MNSPLRLRSFAAYKRFGDRRRPQMARVSGLLRLYHAGYRLLKPSGEVRSEAMGMTITMDAADDVMFPSILAYGVHEPEETALIQATLHPSMVVFDLGANVGYYSILAARCVGEQGRVFAFEPEPRNHALLCSNIRANHADNVVPMASAVSNTSERLKLYLDRYNLGAHTLASTNVQTAAAGVVEVPSVTIDDFFAQEKPGRLDFIKMDVQGAEARVLEGGERTIRGNDTKMLLEYWPAGLRNMGANPLGLLERLRTWGYRASIVDHRGLQPVEDLSAILEEAVRREYLNVFFEKRA
jgi:FkbM family methyltransferase